MSALLNTDLRSAVADAVNVVNHHAGQTCVHLRFAGDTDHIDFVANSANLLDGVFEFKAGFETVCGKIDELEDIRTQVIGH